MAVSGLAGVRRAETASAESDEILPPGESHPRFAGGRIFMKQLSVIGAFYYTLV